MTVHLTCKTDELLPGDLIFKDAWSVDDANRVMFVVSSEPKAACCVLHVMFCGDFLQIVRDNFWTAWIVRSPT